MGTKQLIIRRSLFLLLAFFTILSLVVSCTSAAPAPTSVPAPAATAAPPKAIELSLALYQPTTHDFVRIYNEYAPKFELYTGGRVKVKVFPGETLAKGAEMWDAIQRGVADIAYPYLPYQATTMPLLDMGNLPLWRDDKGVWETFEKGNMAQLIERVYKNQGLTEVMPVFDMPCGIRWFGNTKKAVKVPSDMKGLKIRATGKVEPLMMQLSGATAVNISAPETYEALERGIVDGALGYYTNWIAPYNWIEPTKYHLNLVTGNATMQVIMRRSSYEKLPADTKPIVLDLLKQANVAIKLWMGWEESYYLTKVVPVKTQFYTPTAEERAIWQKEVFDPMIKDWVTRTGPIAEEALKIINQYNK